MSRQPYSREAVAQAVESMVANFVDRPGQSPALTEAERAEWRGFPAVVRAYQGHTLYIDPHEPLGRFLRTSRQIHPAIATPAGNQ